MDDPHAAAAIISVRMFDLIFAIFGWAAALMITGRRIHCGGRVRSNARDRERYVNLLIGGFSFVLIMGLLLVKGYLATYWILAIGLSALICGEIGWGDCWKVFKQLRR